jgi:adenylate cyclase
VIANDAPLTIDDLRTCFLGVVPAVIATASAGGVPNVTYLSRAHPVDHERIAVSNQFLSKSSRNVAENPRASLLLVRPDNHDEFRVTMVFERTERRGPIFDRLRNDLATIAALTSMQDVFRLAAADVYRVTNIERVGPAADAEPHGVVAEEAFEPATLGELCARLSRCSDLDTLVRVTVDGLAEVLGYEHSQLLLLDEDGSRLFTIASHGYADEGIGAEVAVGEGLIGMVASTCAPISIGNLRQMAKYARTVRTSFEASGEITPGQEIPMVGLDRPGSQLAVPAMALGQLVGVLIVESTGSGRFAPPDASMLTVVASIVANAIETLRTEVRMAGAVAARSAMAATPPSAQQVHVRHFALDGSTFLDGDYLIKGVAGKLLWSLLRQYQGEGRTEFTNREVRLDPTLDLPDFRDNFESRLILLKRRLDERQAAIRIEKTGRGRFRLLVGSGLRLEAMTAS